MHRTEHVSARSDFSVGLDSAAGDARYVRKNALQPAATDYIRLGAAPLAIGAINIDGSSFGGVAINATGSVSAGAASFTTGAFNGAVTIMRSGVSSQYVKLDADNGDMNITATYTAIASYPNLVFQQTKSGPTTRAVGYFDPNGKFVALYETLSTGNLTVGASTFVVTAATGAVSILGGVGIGATTGTANLTLGTASPSGNNSVTVAMVSSNTYTNWEIKTNAYGVNGSFNITPSTAGGGSTFSTPTVKLSGTDTALAGALAIIGALSVGTSTPHTSAQAQGDTTAKGWLFPRMTTVQKNAIGTPATGLVVFDTTLAKLCVYTGAAWETITSV